MKNGIRIWALIAICALGFAQPSSVSATSVDTLASDISCSNVGDFTYEVAGQNGITEQQFVPTKDRLSAVDLIVGGWNVTGGSVVKVSIVKASDESITGSAIGMPTVSSKTLRRWTFSAPLTVVPNDVYKIRTEVTYGPGSLYWYTASDTACDGNARSHALEGGTNYGFDFGYTTRGYNDVDLNPPVVSTPEATPATESATTTTTTSTTSDASTTTYSATSTTTASTEAPSSAVTESIKAPTGIKAEFSDTAKTVRISWKKSTTTSIDGYKVFRTETKGSKYVLIGSTKSSVAELVDTQNIVSGKTYYYIARAYKTTQQSENSDVATLVIPAFSTETVVANPSGEITEPVAEPVQTTTTSSNAWLYVMLVALVIVVGFIGYAMYHRQKMHRLNK